MAFRKIISTVTTTTNHYLRRHITTSSIRDIIGKHVYIGHLQKGFEGPCLMLPARDVFVFRLDVPGIHNSDLKYSSSGSNISVSAQEPKTHRLGLSRCEARYYELDPFVYKLEKATAEVKNGVLCVMVPKFRVEDRNGWVEIKMGSLKIKFDGLLGTCEGRDLKTDELMFKVW